MEWANCSSRRFPLVRVNIEAKPSNILAWGVFHWGSRTTTCDPQTSEVAKSSPVALNPPFNQPRTKKIQQTQICHALFKRVAFFWLLPFKQAPTRTPPPTSKPDAGPSARFPRLHLRHRQQARAFQRRRALRVGEERRRVGDKGLGDPASPSSNPFQGKSKKTQE